MTTTKTEMAYAQHIHGGWYQHMKPKVQTKTAELALATSSPVEHTIPDLDRLIRLVNLRNDPMYARVLGTRFTVEQLIRARNLVNAGFTTGWVTAEFVLRFPYAAQVYSDDLHSGPAVRDGRNITTLIYAADIPERVLAECEAIREVTYGVTHITIHSLEPLPVEEVVTSAPTVGALSFIDPVAVGWLGSPRIVYSPRTRRVQRCASDCLGVIIAIWDFGQEVEAFL